MLKYLYFLKSTRFWQVVVTAILISLMEYGVIDSTAGQAIASIFSSIFGLSVVIRTVDRFGENIRK